MASRIAWIAAALVAGLLLLVVGARQVLRRSDTPLVTAQVNPPLVPVRPDGGDAGVSPAPGLDAAPGQEADPEAVADGGGVPFGEAPGPRDGGFTRLPDGGVTGPDGGAIGEETAVEALARQLEARLQLEERLNDLEDAVDSLEADRELLLDALSDAEARLAALEDVEDAEAERLAEQTPRFDRVAVLEGALTDLRQAVASLGNGSGSVSGVLGQAEVRIERVADEAARLGQDLEAERLEGALGRISAAYSALTRNDLFDARVAAAQALTLTAGARDLARTDTALP